MLVPFDQLPNQSRIWIYPSNRKFSEGEIFILRGELNEFLSKWTAHKQSLETSYDLPYNQFILLAVNQQTVQASGCSIDASVRFIQEVEKKINVLLLDKMNVTFKQGESLVYKPLDEFIKMSKAKLVSGDTIVFNNLVDTVGDYKKFWEIPAKESWHNRFIK